MTAKFSPGVVGGGALQTHHLVGFRGKQNTWLIGTWQWSLDDDGRLRRFRRLQFAAAARAELASYGVRFPTARAILGRNCAIFHGLGGAAELAELGLIGIGFVTGETIGHDAIFRS